MKSKDEQNRKRLAQARDKLDAKLRNHPDVVMVDIGIDPIGKNASPVLRVHSRTEAKIADLPDTVDGFQIRQILGEYRLE